MSSRVGKIGAWDNISRGMWMREEFPLRESGKSGWRWNWNRAREEVHVRSVLFRLGEGSSQPAALAWPELARRSSLPRWLFEEPSCCSVVASCARHMPQSLEGSVSKKAEVLNPHPALNLIQHVISGLFVS